MRCPPLPVLPLPRRSPLPFPRRPASGPRAPAPARYAPWRRPPRCAASSAGHKRHLPSCCNHFVVCQLGWLESHSCWEVCGLAAGKSHDVLIRGRARAVVTWAPSKLCFVMKETGVSLIPSLFGENAQHNMHSGRALSAQAHLQRQHAQAGRAGPRRLHQLLP